MAAKINHDKLRESEVTKSINKLALNGVSWNGIARYLGDKHKFKTTGTAVKKAYGEITIRRDQELATDKDLRVEYKDSLKRVFKFLNKQSNDMEQIWTIAMEMGTINQSNIKDILPIAKEIRERTKLFQDIIDRIESPGQKIQNLNLNVTSQNNMKFVEDYLILLEKSGIIKKLKLYPFEAGAETLSIDALDVEFKEE